jgi:WD40 repeat protein
VAELVGASGPLWSVAFDPYNQWVAAGTDNGQIRFWRADDQVAVYTYQATIGPIFALAFSADGTRLAIGGEQQVTLFEIRQVNDGLELENPVPLTIAGRVLNLAFNPNGKYLAIASDRASNELEFWRLDPLLRIALNGHQGSITDIAFSADGIILASASRDGTARLWIINEITNSADDWHILVHRSAVISLAFNPDNTQLATLSLNGTVTLWNVAEGEAVAERLP